MRIAPLVLVLLLLLSAQARSQVQCSDIFTNGAAVNDPGGSMTFNWHSRIRTTNVTVVDTPTLNDSSSWNNCGGSVCTGSGSAAASSAPSFQAGGGSDGAISVASSGSETHPAGDYTTIFVGSRGELFLGTNGGTTYTEGVSTSDRVNLVLEPGDYWIDGNLSFNSRATISPARSGTVRLFVNGTVSFGDRVNNNSFSPENFLVYATGAITLSSRADVNGFLYSGSGQTYLGFQALVTGAVSGSEVVFNSQADIDYDDAALGVADFSPFCTSTPVVPNPVALFYLDEASWSANPGGVSDSSGNNLDGQAVSLGGLPTTSDSNPAISGNPGTCRYGDFDDSTDGYIEIPDNALLDFSSDFSVAVWIYPRSFPGSGNLKTIISKDTNYEFHLNSSGQVNWWWGGGGRELTSSSAVTLNAWNHVAITFQSGSQAVYINGVSAGTNNSSASLTQNNNSLFIGTDWNYHSRRFDGFIDEVKIYDASLTAAQVAAVRDETHACTSSDPLTHYRIDHSGTAITCLSTNVTITPHSVSHANPVPDATGSTITIRATSTTPGWNASNATWSLDTGTPGNFTALANGQAQYQFASGETGVVLNLANTTAASIDIDIDDGAFSDVDGDGTEDQVLVFVDSGFVFYEDANNDGNGDGTPIVANMVAGGISTPSIIQAVRTDSNSGACLTGAVGTYNVEWAYECVNPTTCQLDRDLSINGTPIEENNLGTITDYQTVNLTFDAEGEAPFQFEYFDVGNIRLHARLSLEAGTAPLVGTSDVTTVYPADLSITNIESPSGTANPGTTTTGNGFVYARMPFSVTVEALNADGRRTPNYGLENSPEGIELVASSLVMPVGGNLPVLNAPSAFNATATLGRFENDSVNWPEAGTIIIYARNDDYLGSGMVTGSDSGNVGRFYPQEYRMTSNSLLEGCASGGFTWMSDPSLAFNFSLSAQSLGATLANYDATLGYPVGNINSVAENANNGTNLSARTSMPASTFVAGVYSVNSMGEFARLTTPDGPYASLQFGIQDTGGVDSLDFQASDLTMHAAQSNNCTGDGDCNAVAIGGAINVYFGRLLGLNAHGPESAPLAVTLQTQYWNGTEFFQNTDDDCTVIDFSDIQFDGNSLSTDANRTVRVGGTNSTGLFTQIIPGTNFTFVDGDAGLVFSAPGEGNTGEFTVDIDLTNYDFLRSDWNNDGDFSDDTSLPSLEIHFGRYRGHDRVIYWREVF